MRTNIINIKPARVYRFGKAICTAQISCCVMDRLICVMHNRIKLTKTKLSTRQLNIYQKTHRIKNAPSSDLLTRIAESTDSPLDIHSISFSVFSSVSFLIIMLSFDIFRTLASSCYLSGIYLISCSKVKKKYSSFFYLRMLLPTLKELNLYRRG